MSKRDNSFITEILFQLTKNIIILQICIKKNSVMKCDYTGEVVMHSKSTDIINEYEVLNNIPTIIIALIVGAFSAVVILAIYAWIKKPKESDFAKFFRGSMEQYFGKMGFIAFSLLSLLVAVMAFIAFVSNRQFETSILVGLFSSLVAALVAYFLIDYYLSRIDTSPMKSLSEQIRTGFQQISNLKDSSLTGYTTASNYISISDYVDDEVTHIRMCFLTGTDELRNNLSFLKSLLRKKKPCEIEIIMVDLNLLIKLNQELPEVLFGACPFQDLIPRHQTSVDLIMELYAAIKSDKKGVLKVYFSSSLPLGHYVWIMSGEESTVLYTPYVQNVITKECHTYKFELSAEQTRQETNEMICSFNKTKSRSEDNMCKDEEGLLELTAAKNEISMDS